MYCDLYLLFNGELNKANKRTTWAVHTLYKILWTRSFHIRYTFWKKSPALEGSSDQTYAVQSTHSAVRNTLCQDWVPEIGETGSWVNVIITKSSPTQSNMQTIFYSETKAVQKMKHISQTKSINLSIYDFDNVSQWMGSASGRAILDAPRKKYSNTFERLMYVVEGI